MKALRVILVSSLLLFGSLQAVASGLFGPDLCDFARLGQADQITAETVKASGPTGRACALANASDGAILDLLLQHGVDINTVTDRHVFKNMGSAQNALFYAIGDGHADHLQALIDRGIDVNEQDEFGMTPLIFAVWAPDESALAILLKAGADPQIKDHFGNNALCFAKSTFSFLQDEKIISILENAGATCDQ